MLKPLRSTPGDPRVKRSRPWQSTAYELRRLELCAREATGRILDVGHAQFPNPFLDGEVTVGIDRNRPNSPSGYAADLVGSVEDIPQLVGKARFDTVIAGELLEHLERPYDFLRTIGGVLGGKGRVVISTPNPIGFPNLFFEAVISRRRFYTPDHTLCLTPRWVVRILERTDYELLKIVPVGLWLPVGYLPWCPRWCSYQLIYVARPKL